MLSRCLRWGILGNSNIARNKVIPALAASGAGAAVALASRRAGTSADLVNSIGIERSYTAYEDLLRDETVDAVYIGLPNSAHYEWALAALEAGKHVLCEKPIVTQLDEALQLRAVASERRLVVLEGLMIRHHPQWQWLLSKLADGCLGEIRLIQASFSFTLSSPNNIRAKADLGGGALFDLGLYLLSAAWMITKVFPRLVNATATCLRGGDVDADTSITLSYDDGAIAQLSCSLDRFAHQRLNIIGTKGSLEMGRPFSIMPNDIPPIILDQKVGAAIERTCDPVGPANQFTEQFRAFANVVSGAPPAYSIDQSIAVQRMFAAVRQSVASGAQVELGPAT